MNIMYAADENYVEIAGVSMLSLIEHNKQESLHFFLVEDQISRENKDRLRHMVRGNGAEMTFLKKPDIRGLLGVELRTLRWSDSAFARLFLQELFADKPEVDRLLYVDCDTLIVGRLTDLYNIDLEGYIGAACLECMSNVHKKIIGAKKTDNYINSGVLLMDVKRWISEDIGNLTVEFIRKHRGKIEYVDQGVINGTISNRLKRVSPRYNLTTLAFDFTYDEMQIYRKPQFGYSRKEWEDAVQNPVIIHFTTSFLSIRPWYEASGHPYAAHWKRIHDKTPWKNCKYRDLPDRKSIECKIMLYKKMPKWLAIRCAGFLHAYIKPLIYIIL